MDETTAMKMEYLRILKELHRETALDTNKQMEQVCKSIEEDLGIIQKNREGIAVKVNFDMNQTLEVIQKMSESLARMRS